MPIMIHNIMKNPGPAKEDHIKWAREATDALEAAWLTTHGLTTLDASRLTGRVKEKRMTESGILRAEVSAPPAYLDTQGFWGEPCGPGPA